MTDDVTRRLAAIEERLARLEGGETTGAEVQADDRFWALHALQQQVPEPGGVLFTGSVAVREDERYEWQEGRLTGDLLDADWGELAASLGALAHPVRLALVQAVLRGTRAVAELSGERFGTSGQLYHHLRQLVAAGWLKAAGRGRYVVPPARVLPLLVIVMGADR